MSGSFLPGFSDSANRFRSVDDGSAPCQTFADFVQAAGRLYVTSVETPVNSYSLVPFQLEVPLLFATTERGAARASFRVHCVRIYDTLQYLVAV